MSRCRRAKDLDEPRSEQERQRESSRRWLEFQGKFLHPLGQTSGEEAENQVQVAGAGMGDSESSRSGS
jgi:hypothetical protein